MTTNHEPESGLIETILYRILGYIMMLGATGLWLMMMMILPGWVYWLWVAIQVGSFGMFLFAFIGPFALVASILGIWMFIFGAPDWLAWLVL